MSFMDYVPGIAGFITANAWPMFATAVVLYYRREVRDLIKRFQRGKFLGQELELSEIKKEADEAIQKSYAAMEELRELSVVLSETAVEALAYIGEKHQHTSIQEKLNRLYGIQEVLRKIGVDEEKIKKVSQCMISNCRFHHTTAIVEAIVEANSGPLSAFRVRIEWDKSDFLQYITEEKLEISKEVLEALDDLDYFDRTNQLRNPKQWKYTLIDPAWRDAEDKESD